MNQLKVIHIHPQDVLARAAEIVTVHQSAFGKTDEYAALYRDQDIPKMVDYAGLACVGAFMDGEMVGFALGHDAAARPGWFGNVLAAVQDTPVAGWLADAWCLADIAVLPELQGHGIGNRMHAALMASISKRHAMLITYHGDHPAKRFYRRHGWTEVIPDLLYYPGASLTSLMEYIGPDR